ncbi:hypothetical protein [Shewanella surugensis]|uniref:Uncharacterized protein n=1 Tax=Shewanella surugensis TaxID=212020 RepID=A0ABT0LGT3_9GAMM|nr:hypothetical protein [Shewanella surugensis]MCL1126904.1 hypothetical protein [Shewanella surugensis]
MSYFNYPRIIFDGTFQADPSTLNNTPNNYNPKNQIPESPDSPCPKVRSEVFTSQQQNNIELYWNPAGTGNFNLNAKITKIIYGPNECVNSPSEDPWIGQSIKSVFTVTPPKLVDLDPMQMNVSEVWAMTLGLGDNSSNFTGNFMPIGFVESWIQAQAVTPSSASASAIYQSLLIGLNDTNLSEELKNSKLIKALDVPNKALSINFNVRAYNVKPQIYQWNCDIKYQLATEGIPDEVISSLEPLLFYQMNAGQSLGQIPTPTYFNQQLKALLTPSNYDEYHEKIMVTAAMAYTPASQYEFSYGQAFGNIGPLAKDAADAPDFFTAARMLQPVTDEAGKQTTQYSHNYAPCQLFADSNHLSINLGNALPTLYPAGHFIDQGLLRLGYVNNTGDQKATIKDVTLLSTAPFNRSGDSLFEQGGIVDIQLTPEQITTIEKNPLTLVSVDDNQNITQILLSENPEGLFLRADQFVFRMNSGTAHLKRGGENQPDVYGNEVTVNIYARQFGKPLAHTEITLALLSEEQAFLYTNQTLGTGGTLGLVNISIPQNALNFDATVTTDLEGKASVTVKANNPGNPRAYIDGQVYFLSYNFKNEDYQGHGDDLVSIQIYQEQPGFGELTWDGSIGDILSQYGKLYPVMSQFDLSSYASVKLNSQKIKGVLLRNYNDPLYMPVVRDLSQDRIHMITQWIDKGCPLNSSDIHTNIA